MSTFQTDRILIPFDFSDPCVEAVRLGIDLAGDEGHVHVVHVMVDWYPTHPSVVLADYNEEQFKGKALKSMEQALRNAGIPGEQVFLHILIGDPGTQVAAFVDEINASLIVIPSHGRRGIKRVFLGSVAERVVRLANCPVLVTKARC